MNLPVFYSPDLDQLILKHVAPVQGWKSYPYEFRLNRWGFLKDSERRNLVLIGHLEKIVTKYNSNEAGEM